MYSFLKICHTYIYVQTHHHKQTNTSWHDRQSRHKQAQEACQIGRHRQARQKEKGSNRQADINADTGRWKGGHKDEQIGRQKDNKKADKKMCREHSPTFYTVQSKRLLISDINSG